MFSTGARRRIVGILAGAAFVAAGCVPGDAQDQEEAGAAVSGEPHEHAGAVRKRDGGLRLGGRFRGEAAIRALAEHLPAVAVAHGLSETELRALLRQDESLWVDETGLLVFVDPTPGAPSPDEATFGDGTISNNATADQIPDAETFRLHSKPESAAKIWLDFEGATITTSAWNYNGPIVAPPYNFDGDPAFSSAEMREIRAIWLVVAEDFAPFDVDVTTERPSSPDMNRFIRIMIAPTDFYGAVGGVCYVGSFKWNEASMDNQICWVFPHLHNYSTKNISEAASHEIGHSVGLRHWGLYDAAGTLLASYFAGHGNWAPIMGVGYYRPVTQWSRGEYTGAGVYALGQKQDDLAVMSTYMNVRSDEDGNRSGSAPLIKGSVSNGIVTADHRAYLSSGSDVDLILIEALDGPLSLRVDLASSFRPDADFRVRLLGSGGGVLADSDPASVAAVAIDLPWISAGTYYLEIQPVGYLNPAVDGYSSYGSLGAYHVNGTFAGITAGNPNAPPPPPPPPPTDTIAPTASIVSPTGGTVRIRSRISVVARGADETALRNVSIYANGTRICSVAMVGNGDVSCTWQVKGKAGDQIRLSTTASDAAGNTGSSALVYLTAVR